jgi:hypothetical protein
VSQDFNLRFSSNSSFGPTEWNRIILILFTNLLRYSNSKIWKMSHNAEKKFFITDPKYFCIFYYTLGCKGRGTITPFFQNIYSKRHGRLSNFLKICLRCMSFSTLWDTMRSICLRCVPKCGQMLRVVNTTRTNGPSCGTQRKSWKKTWKRHYKTLEIVPCCVP